MKNLLQELWRWNGTINRARYLSLGILLFAIKFNIDRFISQSFFGRSWSIFDYFRANQDQIGIAGDPRGLTGSTVYYLTILAVSLPFLYLGILLTVRRLRSAALPLYLVALFLVPYVKFLLFTILCVIPSKRPSPIPPLPARRRSRFLDQLIPKSAFGSAAMAVGITVLSTYGGVWLSASLLEDYGLALFVGLPFWMGFIAVLIHGYHEPRTMDAAVKVALFSIALSGAVLLLFAFEGIICLIMAAPIAIILTLMGALVAHAIQARHVWREYSTNLFCMAFLSIPFALASEPTTREFAPILEVKSRVIVDAPVATVWKNVVSFSELPAPTEWFFRAGVAYPRRAEIFGHGPGAVRHCNFSTGAFVEPIEVWDEPRLLRFSVTSNPPPMQEWTPYREIHPPHLDGFLVSKGGQFRLTALPGGRTELEGTTWYQHHMWPVEYWQIWSDWIIHRIHLRVLNHIKRISEGAAS